MRDVVKDLANYRSKTLRRGSWLIGTRLATNYITMHWNGPAVPENQRRGDGVLVQLKTDVAWQTSPDWPGAKGGADGLQYHVAVDADGLVWHCRDDSAMLWHCGHPTGNSESLSLHILVGRTQTVTDLQWNAAVSQLDAWQKQYHIPIKHVLGHCEWGRSTDCPGPDLLARLQAYRKSPPFSPPQPLPNGLRQFTVAIPPESRANVRQGPSRAYLVATQLSSGAEILVDGILNDEHGEIIGGKSQWAHMALVPDQQSDLGFVHLSTLSEVV